MKDAVIDVKLGTEEETAWKNIGDATKKALAQGKREQIINEHIIDLARTMQDKEKGKI